MRYPNVFTSAQIGPVEVANRLYFSPHGIPLVASALGISVPSEDFAHYFEARARGGIGLLIHSLNVTPRASYPCPWTEESLPSFRAVAERVHEHGAKLFAEIWDKSGPWDPLAPNVPPINASAVQGWASREADRVPSLPEIAALVDAYARTARNLRKAGYDGAELHATHGRTLEYFLSPRFNRRTDRYGGDLDGRMRLLVEALEAVRAEAGADFAVGIRLICDERLPGGLTRVESREIVARLRARGLIHFVDLDIGTEPMQNHDLFPTMLDAPLANRDHVRYVGAAARPAIPVLAVGPFVRTIAQADELVASGDIDLVGMTRQLIADPDVLRNARAGDEARTRPCIGANACIGRQVEPLAGWGCAANPVAGRERRWGAHARTGSIEAARVTVVGAGPAGLEAARVAASRGHTVIVWEQRAKPGGQLALWATLPDRAGVLALRDWYVARLVEARVDLRLGEAASADAVLAERPNVAIIATGSRWAADGDNGFTGAPIPGFALPHVLTPEKVLEDGARPRGRVLILDEERGMTAVGVAEVLAGAGAEVEIVTRDADPIGRHVQSHHFGPQVSERLARLGIRVTVGAFVREIRERSVRLSVGSGREEERAVDAVVLATMRVPVNDLASALEGRVRQLYVVGDALSPRMLYEATYEAHRFARYAGDASAPRTIAEDFFRPIQADAFARPAAPRPAVLAPQQPATAV